MCDLDATWCDTGPRVLARTGVKGVHFLVEHVKVAVLQRSEQFCARIGAWAAGHAIRVHLNEQLTDGHRRRPAHLCELVNHVTLEPLNVHLQDIQECVIEPPHDRVKSCKLKPSVKAIFELG